MPNLSHDPVVIQMALDVLDELGAEAGRIELDADGVEEAAAFTYMIRGGDTFAAQPDEILPAVVEAFERLADDAA